MACQLTFLERERISQMHYAGRSNAEIATESGPSVLDDRPRDQAEFRGGRVFGLVCSRACATAAPVNVRSSAKWIVPRSATLCGAAWCAAGRPTKLPGARSPNLPTIADRQISHQTIYTWIESQPPEDRRHFAGFLRLAGSRSPRDDRRGRIPNQVSIEGRPKVVDKRRRYGDWEGDTVVGAGSRAPW